jgi:hypothetical protein
LIAHPRADFEKNTNVTIDLAVHILTNFKARGVVLPKARIRLQLDSTSSSNKHNIIMRSCGHMTYTGNIASMDVMLLRKGHTHEDSAVHCQDERAVCSDL